MGDVVTFDGATKLDIPPERVLTAAAEAKLTDVVVVGFDAEGEFYFASSLADGADALWLLKLGEHKLMKIGGA